MGYFKVKKQFTRASRVGMLVGHPEHKDPRGRFLEINDDTLSAQLASEGLIGKISRSAYHKGIEGEDVDGGDVVGDQLAGKRPRVSARWTDDALADEARMRGVDISKAKNRGEVIKMINAKDTDGGPDDVDGTDNAHSRTGRETAETTRHSKRASPQNDVGSSGSVDRVMDGVAAPTVEVDEDEEAPTGGGDSGEQ